MPPLSQLSSLLLLALAVAGVSAAPAQLEKRVYKFTRQAVPRTHQKNGPAEMERTYRKYGWDVPETMHNAAINATIRVASQQKGEAEAQPEENDSMFLAPVKVGGQELMINFDTGSADFWIFNTQLPQAKTKGHGVYDPHKSKTYKHLKGASWQIQYGDKSTAEGNVGIETVSVGSATVPSQAIELATKISDSFVEDVSSDGIMGLGFMTSNKVRPQQQNTFFGNIADSLKEPLFTAQLKHATAGSYQFGEVDKTQFKGTLTMQKVDTSSGWWQFDCQKVAVGNNNKIHLNKTATPAIADTGTSLLLMDDFVLKTYYDTIPGVVLGDQGYTFPCDTDLPDLHLGLGPDYMATIPGELINYQRIGPNVCYGGLQSSQGQPIQILGDLLFKAQFTVFDMRGPSIGFAPHA